MTVLMTPAGYIRYSRDCNGHTNPALTIIYPKCREKVNVFLVFLNVFFVGYHFNVCLLKAAH